MSEEALKNLNECVLRIAVFSEDKSECAKIIPEISPLQLNGLRVLPSSVAVPACRK